MSNNAAGTKYYISNVERIINYLVVEFDMNHDMIIALLEETIKEVKKQKK